MSYYNMGCDGDLRAEARDEAWRDRHPHDGDAEAVRLIKSVLTPDARQVLKSALKIVQSDHGCEVLATLIDDTLPAIDLWVSACEEEGSV